MLVEYPIILSHNINRLGDHNEGGDTSVWTSEATNKPSSRTKDDLRYTFWEATSAADQDLFIRTPNFINNPGFENNASDWTLSTSGTATVTLSRVLTDALEGDACAEVDTTVYSSGTIKIKNDQGFTLKEDKTYQFTASIKTDDGTNDTFTLRILDNAGATLASDTITLVTTAYKSVTVEYTATANKRDVRVEIEFPQRVVTSFVDATWFGEIRENDYILFDQGHNLIDATVTVQSRDNPLDSYSTVTSNTVTTQCPYYQEFTGTKAIDWRIQLTNLPRTPEIPQIFLGKKFQLTHSPVAFDPTQEKATSKLVTSEAGIVREYHNFSQRILNANFTNISPEEEFPDFFEWWLDIGRGRYPFWWIWKPTTDPNDIFFYRLSDKTFQFPFDKHIRSGSITAEEVLGATLVRSGPDHC